MGIEVFDMDANVKIGSNPNEQKITIKETSGAAKARLFPFIFTFSKKAFLGGSWNRLN